MGDNNSKKDIILDLTGVYCRFLVSSGFLGNREKTACNPFDLFKNLTENDRPEGTPILSLMETKKCLKQIYNGMIHFYNTKYRNTVIVRGLGYIVRKLYEPYMNEDDPEIHECFYYIIAKGAFSLQMKNCAMARGFYRGLYDTWTLAVESKEYLLKKLSWEGEYVFDDLLSHEDPAEDPASDPYRYPWNMYSYNVDNVILLYSDLKEYLEIVEKQKFVNLRNIKQFRQAKDAIYSFFQGVTPFYKARCDYYNKRETKYTKMGDPAEHYNNMDTQMKKCEGLQKDFAPYLFYTCSLFSSTDQKTIQQYEDMERVLLNTPFVRFHAGCPIFAQRIRMERRYEKEAVTLMHIIADMMVACIGVAVLLAIVHWWLSLGFFTKCILVFFGVNLLAGIGVKRGKL